MTIKKQLKLSAAVSIGVALIIFIAIAVTSRQTAQSLQSARLYSQLIHKVFALDMLLSDYLLHPAERERAQWESVYNSLGELLDEIEIERSEDQFFVSFIRQNHQGLNSLFLRLDSREKIPPDSDAYWRYREIVAGQLLVKLDYMVAEASRLVEESQDRMMSAQQRKTVIISVLLIAMIIYSGVVLFLVGNRIAESLGTLQKGTEIIAAGNFDNTIDVKKDDEIGALAGSFNKMAADLKRSYVELRSEIAERQQTEEALRLDEARLEALLQMSQLSASSAEQIADFALEQTVRLSKSKIGFLGFLNEDESILSLHTWSQVVMGKCAVKDKPFHFPVEGAGLWAEAIRRRKPVIINEYSDPYEHKKGVPDGHIPLIRFMAVPVFEGSRIVAIAAVGNKGDGYDAADLRQFTLLMDGMWRVIQRERAEAALRESESLAAMGRALSSVAHDMKTPLIAIGGFTLMVQRHLEEGSEYREKLNIVIKETRRLEKMVKDMLDFSKPLDLQKDQGNLSEVVNECISIVEDVAKEKNVMIKTSLQDLPLCLVDIYRMKQALINLVTNAIQASPEGQSISVETYTRRGDLFVDVVDCGCGIPPDKREVVFDPFFTTKKEGTGLGLPIVKKIIDAHGGYIQILDNTQGGITFRVVLPHACKASGNSTVERFYGQ
jgi:signal transduction histidine kinase/HAMP domain-containing protein